MWVKTMLITIALANGFVPPFTDHYQMSQRIVGIVEQGKQEARKFGFPTANVRLSGSTQLLPGVYCGKAEVNGKIYAAMSYFDDCASDTLEVHLFQFSGNLYHQGLIVTLTYFVRHPLSFENEEISKTQIKRDAEFCLNYLEGQEERNPLIDPS
jgi:riboflavin kinase/FMN adenylyltransferase